MDKWLDRRGKRDDDGREMMIDGLDRSMDGWMGSEMEGYVCG